MKKVLKVKKISLLLYPGKTDRISLELDTTEMFPTMKYGKSATIETQPGHGLMWIRENFGCEPDEIIRVPEHRSTFAK